MNAAMKLRTQNLAFCCTSRGGSHIEAENEEFSFQYAELNVLKASSNSYRGEICVQT